MRALTVLSSMTIYKAKVCTNNNLQSRSERAKKEAFNADNETDRKKAQSSETWFSKTGTTLLAHTQKELHAQAVSYSTLRR